MYTFIHNISNILVLISSNRWLHWSVVRLLSEISYKLLKTMEFNASFFQVEAWAKETDGVSFIRNGMASIDDTFGHCGYAGGSVKCTDMVDLIFSPLGKKGIVIAQSFLVIDYALVVLTSSILFC